MNRYKAIVKAIGLITQAMQPPAMGSNTLEYTCQVALKENLEKLVDELVKTSDDSDSVKFPIFT